MLINPQSPQIQTLIFILLLTPVIFFTLKKHTPEFNLTKNATSELKGIAILTILFGHIGYFLSQNHQFLYPLSIASGMGVNLFLFLSGFGLTKSSLGKNLSFFDYYKKRVIRLFLPLWAVLTIFYLLDFFILKKNYPLELIFQNYVGFFPQSDIYAALNSPLWYFSLILFYYLVFPLTLIGPLKYISPLILFYLSAFVLKMNLPVSETTLHLYSLHTIAFPLGVFFGLLNLNFKPLNYLSKINFLSTLFNLKTFRYSIMIVLSLIFSYYAVFSGVGTDPHLEEITSIFLMLILITIFLFKDFRIDVFNYFGKYSYGIYLIHWPLLYRYDFLYKFLPAFLATFLYLFFLTLLAKLLEEKLS